MDLLPNEILYKLLSLLDTSTRKTLRFVNSRWNSITTQYFRTNCQCRIELESKLHSFLTVFSNCVDFPLGKLTFREDILISNSCEGLIKEFAEKYGKYITQFEVVASPWVLDYYRNIFCNQREIVHNLGVILSKMHNLLELIVETSYPMENTEVFTLPKLRNIKMRCYSANYSSKPCFLLQLSNVPCLRYFHLEEKCLEKVYNVLKNLEVNNPNVAVCYKILEIPSTNNLFLEKIFDTRVKFQELSVAVECPSNTKLDKVWSKFDQWMSIQGHFLVKLKLYCCWRRNELMKVDTFAALEELELQAAVLLAPVRANQFPKLRILRIESEHFQIFSGCILPTVKTIFFNTKLNQRQYSAWHQIFPKVQNLFLLSSSYAIIPSDSFHMAFSFKCLRNLHIRGYMQYPWRDITGGLPVLYEEEIPVVSGQENILPAQLPSLKDLKRENKFFK